MVFARRGRAIPGHSFPCRNRPWQPSAARPASAARQHRRKRLRIPELLNGSEPGRIGNRPRRSSPRRRCAGASHRSRRNRSKPVYADDGGPLMRDGRVRSGHEEEQRHSRIAHYIGKRVPPVVTRASRASALSCRPRRGRRIDRRPAANSRVPLDRRWRSLAKGDASTFPGIAVSAAVLCDRCLARSP